MKWLTKKIFRFTFNLFFIELLTEIFFSLFICWNHLNCHFSALIVFANNLQNHFIIKEIGEGFSCDKGFSNHNWLRRIPEGIFILIKIWNDPCFKIRFWQVFYNIISVWEFFCTPPVTIAFIIVDNFDFNRSLGLNFFLFFFRMHKHFHWEIDIFLKLFGD